MHVCFVSTYFPQPCGIASYVHYLAEALHLLEPSLQITLLAENPAEQHPNSLFQVSGIFAREGDYPAKLINEIKRISPDIVHLQHEYGIFGIDERFLQLLRQIRDMGIRSIVTLHTVHTRLSFFAGCAAPHLRHLLRNVNIEEYQRQLGELADLVIVHQESSIRQVLLRQGLTSRRVVTIPHGTRVLAPVDAGKARADLQIASNSPLIVAFGYLEESKNLHVLIKAFRLLKTRVSDAKLWLGGYVRFPTKKALAYRNRCLRLIEAYNLKEDVIFSEGLLPEDQVPQLLSAADVACFVYNEDTHSSSGALHLAMGLGKAVVASRIPKFQELAEVSNEILVNPSSTRELSQLLGRLLSDEKFHQYIKQRVAVYARQTAWSSVAQQHLTLYDQLLSGGDPDPRFSVPSYKLELPALAG